MTLVTKTIEVQLPGELLKQIDERARVHGSGRDRLILEFIEQGLKGTVPPHPEMTFAELLKLADGPSPIETMTDDEVADLAEAEVKAYRTEKRSAARSG